MAPDISFIITARNEEPVILEKTISGLIETTEQCASEIIVVDDGSTAPVVCTQKEVLLIRNNAPVGVSQSRRYGASLAKGNVLVWLDAHMTFAPDWLDQMLAHVDSGSLLCSAFWNYEQTIRHCFGADFVWRGERNYFEQLYPGFGLRHRTEFPGFGAVEIPMIIGACYMILRDSYVKLGGFSPLLRIWGCDEQDLSARAWITGIGVKCVTGAKVGHLDRQQFPYTVQFEHLEFNQLTLIKTIFENQTVKLLEEFFNPLPIQVQEWLDKVDLSEWRNTVQSNRQITDKEFFRGFVPSLTHSPFS